MRKTTARRAPGNSPAVGRPRGSAPTRRSVRPLVTIERIGWGPAGAAFLLWLGLEVPEASQVLVPHKGEQPLAYGQSLEIFTEHCDEGRPSLRRIASNRVQITQVGCNVFRVDVNRQEAKFLRFVLHTDRMMLSSGVVVEQYAMARGIGWVGQGGDATVTTFVVNPSLSRPLQGFEDVTTVVAPGGGAEVRLDWAR